MRFNKLIAATALAITAVVAPVMATTAHASVRAQETTIAVEESTPAAEGATTGETATETGKAKVGHDAEECIKVLEEGGAVDECVKAPNPILPATDELIWGTIAFALIFFALWKFLIPAMKKTMAVRSAKIQGDLDAASKTRAEADTIVADYKAKLGDAKAESDRIIDDARQQAETVRKDLIARAEADAASIRAKASEDLNVQADRLKAELQTHVKGLSLELAEKVVGANMNKETNSALVDRYIAELGAK
jgi:F-type H+-transporting ATPase subunit b